MSHNSTDSNVIETCEL